MDRVRPEIEQVELLLQGSRFPLRSELNGDALQVIRAVKIVVPPVLQETA